MSESFTRYIKQNTTDSHQISPHWVITFVIFNTRDTKNYGKLGPADLEPVRKNLVVENDCIAVSVSTSKTNYTPVANITLTGGDINYSTQVSPGDFMLVNIVNSSEKAREIRDRAAEGKKPINKVEDGFKGVFRVNSVGKIINTDPETGQKIVRYQITAYGFTEFQNMIYYNPALGGEGSPLNIYSLNEKLLELLSKQRNVQEILEVLPLMILGLGAKNATNPKVFSSKSQPYTIPSSVFNLLGIEGRFAIDMYRIMLGIWGNTNIGFQDKEEIADIALLQKGFNPNYNSVGSIQSIKGKGRTLQGSAPAQTSPLTNVSLIDLMKRFSNDLINETYACYRLDKDLNAVLPKLIIRQKPFTTEHFNAEVNTTKFLSLPRWKISSDLIYSFNISKNDSLRFNFVHIVTAPMTMGSSGTPQALNNTMYPQHDPKDIERNGLRPYTAFNNFDWIVNGTSVSNAPMWNKLCFDWVYGGHLKGNGTMSCVGIIDPICVGDNLEFEDTIYHIESINHVASIEANGLKTFRTNITLTNGIDKRSSKQGPVYPEMDFTKTLDDREYNYNNNYGTMPGYSDSQDIIGRESGEEASKSISTSFTKNGLKNKINRNPNDKN
jgi:hypothetical protein